MLKAIWPSFAHLPNHLPPSANITTSGACELLILIKQLDKKAYAFQRDDLLLSLLAHSVPILVHLSTEDTLAILSQISYCSTRMVSAAYLGTGQSTSKYGSVRPKGRAKW
jgi:hypothetical protein